MISDGITKAIHTVYKVMKLNLIFIFLSLGGAVVFGIGPALVSVLELYQEYEKVNESYRFQTVIEKFKQNFLRGNQLFLTHLLVLGLLVWNLYIATQIRIWFMAAYVIFLVFVILFGLMFAAINYYVSSHYEVSFKDTIKLSAYLFFSNIFVIFKLLGATLLVMLISSEYKGLFVFITFGAMVLIMCRYLTPIANHLDDQLEVSHENI